MTAAEIYCICTQHAVLTTKLQCKTRFSSNGVGPASPADIHKRSAVSTWCADFKEKWQPPARPPARPPTMQSTNWSSFFTQTKDIGPSASSLCRDERLAPVASKQACHIIAITTQAACSAWCLSTFSEGEHKKTKKTPRHCADHDLRVIYCRS